MKIEAMCESCNEFLHGYNEAFSLDPFCYEHYKTRYCTKDSIGLDGNKISCLKIYYTQLEHFSNPYSFSNQPERSKREDSQKCEMRCSEHKG